MCNFASDVPAGVMYIMTTGGQERGSEGGREGGGGEGGGREGGGREGGRK